MIAYVKGILAKKNPDFVIIDVHGVGYGIYISLQTFYKLPDPGKEAILHTYTHVRENVLQLYGFNSMEEKHMFLDLITVGGVGPRLAIQILSGISPQELRETIMEHDLKRLQKIPGVGKKTAERILLELKHRFKITDDLSKEIEDTESSTSIIVDAISALMNLGYKQMEAQKAVNKAKATIGNDATLETLLKEALRTMM